MLNFREIQQEYGRCYQDKTRIYFIEHYLKTFNATKGRLSPFVIFPRQKAFLRSINDNKASIAIKPRQCGITTISSAWSCGQIVFASKDRPENILCIANKLEQAQELVSKIRDFLDQVPRWMWGSDYYSPDPKSEKNTKSIYLKNAKNMLELFNGCKVYARAASANAARGISAVSILIFDEAAFIEEGMATFSSAVAATASVPYAKIIMVSTPNGMDQLYYNTYKQALAKENNFNAVEFKWYQDPRYNKFLKWYKKDDKTGEDIWIEEEILDETGTIPYDEDKWRKHVNDGFTPKAPWYDEMCKSFNNDPIKIAQELDVSFHGSSDNVIDSASIEAQRSLNVREPLEEMKDPLVEETWFWKPPIEGHRYILGIDPSRGTSEDRTAIEVIDLDGEDENGFPIIEQVMEYVGRKIGDYIGGMAVQYATMYNEAFVVVDATGGQGDAAIITMMQLGYKNFYYADTSQKDYMVQNSSKQYATKDVDKLPGFYFQGNRYPVLANFATMVRMNEFKIRSVRVINEIETWIFKNGRMDHQDGCHDDTITCLGMSLFVMKYSLNKLESVKNKDSAILRSYIMNASNTITKTPQDSMSVRANNNKLPFYNNKVLNKYPSNIQGSCLWVFGKLY